jgi:hypothetical protein
MKGHSFLGWVSYPRFDGIAKAGSWERCGRLYVANSMEAALVGLWMIPCPQLNKRTGEFEIKAVCNPHEDRELGGSLPMLHGDIVLRTRYRSDDATRHNERKLGAMVSREQGDRQYYAFYFFGYPLLAANASGMVWFHVHLT